MHHQTRAAGAQGPAQRHPLLARHYAALFCRKYHNDPKELTPGFLEALQNYSWPGNVREFVNCLEEAVNDAGTDPALYQQHLPAGIRIAAFKSTMATDAPAQEFSDEKDATGRSEQATPALADLSYEEPADATARSKTPSCRSLNRWQRPKHCRNSAVPRRSAFSGGKRLLQASDQHRPGQHQSRLQHERHEPLSLLISGRHAQKHWSRR